MVNPIIPRTRSIFSRAGSKLQSGLRIRAARNPNPPKSSSSGRAKIRRRQRATSLSSHPTRAPLLGAPRPVAPLNPHGTLRIHGTKAEKRSDFSLRNRAPPPSSSAPRAPANPHLPPASSGRSRRDPAREVSPCRSNPQRKRRQGRG